jgi:hypothetical protein
LQIDEQNIFANIELVSELFRGDPGESELTEEAIWGAAVAVDSGNPKNQISAAAEKEIASVTAEIDRVEAETLSQVQKRRLDPSQRIILLGKAIFFDQNLSVRRKESCAFCHTGESIARRALWLARTYRGIMISRRPNSRASIEYAPGPRMAIAKSIANPKINASQESKPPEEQIGRTLNAVSIAAIPPPIPAKVVRKPTKRRPPARIPKTLAT